MCTTPKFSEWFLFINFRIAVNNIFACRSFRVGDGETTNGGVPDDAPGVVLVSNAEFTHVSAATEAQNEGSRNPEKTLFEVTFRRETRVHCYYIIERCWSSR